MLFFLLISDSSVSYPEGLPVDVQSLSHLSFNLCRWCEVSTPVCEGNICSSNCNLTSFCNTTEEICIAIWWDPFWVTYIPMICFVCLLWGNLQSLWLNLYIGNYNEKIDTWQFLLLLSLMFSSWLFCYLFNTAHPEASNIHRNAIIWPWPHCYSSAMSHESAEKRTVQPSWFNMVSISVMKHPEVISLSVLLLDLNENTHSLTRTNANKTCDHNLAFFIVVG